MIIQDEKTQKHPFTLIGKHSLKTKSSLNFFFKGISYILVILKLMSENLIVFSKPYKLKNVEVEAERLKLTKQYQKL